MKATLTRYEATCMIRCMQILTNTPGTKPPLDEDEEAAAASGGAKLAGFIFCDTITITDEAEEAP